MLNDIIRFGVVTIVSWLASKGVFSNNPDSAEITHITDVLVVVLTTSGALFWHWVEEEQEKLKKIAPTPSVSVSSGSLTKIMILCLAITSICGCATLKTDATTLLATIKKDLPGWETAANALWTDVDKVLTSSEFEALLSSFGVSSATISDVEKVVGVVNGKVQITAEVVNFIDGANSAAAQ